MPDRHLGRGRFSPAPGSAGALGSGFPDPGGTIESGDQAVEEARERLLPHPSGAVNFRPDAAFARISAPDPRLMHLTDAVRHARDLVSGAVARAVFLPGFCVLATGNDLNCPAGGEGVINLAGIFGLIVSNADDLLAARDLVRQFLAYRHCAPVAGGKPGCGVSAQNPMRMLHLQPPRLRIVHAPCPGSRQDELPLRGLRRRDRALKWFGPIHRNRVSPQPVSGPRAGPIRSSEAPPRLRPGANRPFRLLLASSIAWPLRIRGHSPEAGLRRNRRSGAGFLMSEGAGHGDPACANTGQVARGIAG